jgi:uncharacterized membrane protein YhiD involved in acid resistance
MLDCSGEPSAGGSGGAAPALRRRQADASLPTAPVADATAAPLTEGPSGPRARYPSAMGAFEPILPLALAVIFGASIGVERQWHHKSAGIKTNTLVALGAAGFSMLSEAGFGPSNNPAQLAAAVVTGIGFIGAGVIIHRGASVQGVNTAATLWACASMGVAIGSRHYAVGAAVFGAVLIVQLLASGLERVINRHASTSGSRERSEISVSCNQPSLAGIDAAWRRFATGEGLVTQRRRVGGERWVVEFSGPELSAIELSAFEEELLRIPGVQQVDSRTLEGDSDDLPGTS